MIVTFIDYGNRETVPLAKIRPLRECWLAVPRGVAIVVDIDVSTNGKFD